MFGWDVIAEKADNIVTIIASKYLILWSSDIYGDPLNLGISKIERSLG